MTKKVSLFLLGEKGYTSLLHLLKFQKSELIDLVVVGVDKDISNDFSSDIISLSQKNHLKIKMRNESFEVKTKFVIAISWRWMINLEKSIHVITLHDSLLPNYRGFAPLVCQLINGEKKIGVTAILSNNEYDKGKIISQYTLEIKYPIKIKVAIKKISKLYCNLLIEILEKIELGSIFLKLKDQKENLATYSLWRDENDYYINWSKSASQISRFVDAVGEPYKGARTNLLGRIVKISDVEIVRDVKIMNRDFGKLIFFDNNFPVIVCGKGLLKITKAHYQDDGSNILPLKKFRIKFN